MPYADLTVGDPSPVKRWIQRHRFVDALRVLSDAPARERIRVLDFGAGDGELVRQMVAVISRVDAVVYEPAPQLMAEAMGRLSGMESVVFADRIDALAANSFDYVFCLEVFEHLPSKETAQAIADIDRLLAPDGFAVVGVPHELFLPALCKGIFRMWRRYGDFDANAENICAAVLGRPPLRRPVAEIAPGISFHFHHLGFDYRALERDFKARFDVQAKWFSPFRFLGAALNSEVYFLLRKAPSAAARNC